MDAADLIRELRAARPAAPEALRERVRLIGATPPPTRRSLNPFGRLAPRRLVLVALPATVVVVAAAAGLTVLDHGDRQRAADAPLAIEAAGDTSRQSAPAAKAAGTEAFTTTAPVPAQDQAQRYSAQLTISVPDNDALSEATKSALETVRRLGGHVVTVQYATAENGLATMTLRVPSARVQDALTALTGLGTIVAQNVQIDDLQGQLDELTKRERALREQIARLSARITAPNIDAATKATLVARRDAARSELAGIRAQSTQVSGEASFATIQLELRTKQGSVVPAPPSRFDDALREAGRILAWEAAALLYLLVVAGPLLVAGAAVWLGLRVLRRRGDERLLGLGS